MKQNRKTEQDTLALAIFVAIAAALLCSLLTGCNYTRATKGDCSVTNIRLFWQTETIHVNWTNVIDFTVNGSRPDGEQLGSVIGTAVKYAK